MATKIQILRSTSGTKPADDSLAFGELAITDSPDGGEALFIGKDSGATSTLVSPLRQMELAGAQTVTGKKTFPIADIAIPATGATDLFLKALDEAGNLVYASPASPTTVAFTSTGGTVSPSASFNTEGHVVTASDIVFYNWPEASLGDQASYLYTGPTGDPVINSEDSQFTNIGSATAFANQAQTDAGVDTHEAIAPATYSVNRNKTLGALSGLNVNGITYEDGVTTAVIAINNLQTQIEANAGISIFKGTMTYNETLPDGSYIPGDYYIFSDTGVRDTEPNLSGQSVDAGDWLICTIAGNETAAATNFEILQYAVTAVTAANVSFDATTSAGLNSAYVQGAIDENAAAIVVNAAAASANASSIVSDEAAISALAGSSGNPSTVGYMDGGTF